MSTSEALPAAAVSSARIADPFRFEHEMFDLVESIIGKLTRRPPERVFREVQTGQGIVDLLAVDFSTDALSHRVNGGVGPITSPLRVAVLSHLRGTHWTSLDRLSRLVVSRPQPLVRSTLRPLAARGLIELDSTRVRATGVWRPIPERLISFELKLSKWKKAARQADNAAWATGRSWTVLDRSRSGGALANREYFTEFGVGLALIDTTGLVQVVERPRPRPTIAWLRAWLGELAWDRLASEEVES
jgi:hypothetical protein